MGMEFPFNRLQKADDSYRDSFVVGVGGLPPYHLEPLPPDVDPNFQGVSSWEQWSQTQTQLITMLSFPNVGRYVFIYRF
jgi:hypothetical protein